MEYLNQFHKESTEAGLKALEEQRKLPLNAVEESKRHFEMHRKLKALQEQKDKK